MPTPIARADGNGSLHWTDTSRTYSVFEGDADALAADLQEHVRGEVRFNSGAQALYATDASNYRQVPIGVVIPRDVDDIVETVAICRRHSAPIVHRGGGTSLAGQCCNNAVVIDSSKYVDKVIEVDPERKIARVEPGCRLDDLRKVAKKYDLTYGPDPSTHEYCTFGGMIGNNACGVHSQMAGRTEDNVEELEILTYDGLRMRVGRTSEEERERMVQEGGRRGEIYRRLGELQDQYADQIRKRYPDIPRRVSGYSLPELLPENDFHLARALVGSEGTCVTILEATVRLVYRPPKRTILAIGYQDICEAGDHVQAIDELGPIGLEGMDQKLIDYMEEKKIHTEYLPLLPEGGGWLLVEFGGETQEEANRKARQGMEVLENEEHSNVLDAVLLDDPENQKQFWAIRESGLGATAHSKEGDDTWPGWEDSAVPPEKVGDYLRELRGLYDKYGYDASVYGHFGQGCIHTRIGFEMRTAQGIRAYRSFMQEATDLCVKYGGSLSAEHGDGQARAEMLPKMYGEELVEAFRQFKEIWDPDWKMNPGKVVDPYRIDENLRLGTDYDPPELETHFEYPEDGGSFSRAALRCVGVGKCRRTDVPSEEVMCPSYLATHEEKHTTRGRARLLFEMLNGDETPDAWKNDDVKDALDLCLACKGCKSDCPVSVDMATYKAEFLSHYYKGRLRPRHAYAFGLIHWWARLASLAPKVANFFAQTPGFDAVFKKAGGVAQERKVPRFAEETLREWFKKRGATQDGSVWISEAQNPGSRVRSRVMLWPDTFNNFFKPDTGKAAVEVLEAAGCQVALPDQMLCCGRPLYDYGMMNLAKRLWRQILDSLQHEIRAGTPLVGLEPSCVAAFRDELINLFPHDEDAKRLTQQTFTLGEFLAEELDGYEPPRLSRKALVHGHCHHKSIMGVDAERALLDKMNLDYKVPAASCCGMAGAFGFEAEHYDVSIQAGEHKLLPAVREADPQALIITDGFSCREQIEQTTDRRALHLAEVLHLAMQQNGKAKAYPERPYLDKMRSPGGKKGAARTTALLAASGFAASALFSFFTD